MTEYQKAWLKYKDAQPNCNRCVCVGTLSIDDIHCGKNRVTSKIGNCLMYGKSSTQFTEGSQLSVYVKVNIYSKPVTTIIYLPFFIGLPINISGFVLLQLIDIRVIVRYMIGHVAHLLITVHHLKYTLLYMKHATICYSHVLCINKDNLHYGVHCAIWNTTM